MIYIQVPRKESISEKIFYLNFSTKIYVVGTQKNHLNEMVLLLIWFF